MQPLRVTACTVNEQISVCPATMLKSLATGGHFWRQHPGQQRALGRLLRLPERCASQRTGTCGVSPRCLTALRGVSGLRGQAHSRLFRSFWCSGRWRCSLRCSLSVLSLERGCFPRMQNSRLTALAGSLKASFQALLLAVSGAVRPLLPCKVCVTSPLPGSSQASCPSHSPPWGCPGSPLLLCFPPAAGAGSQGSGLPRCRARLWRTGRLCAGGAALLPPARVGPPS